MKRHILHELCHTFYVLHRLHRLHIPPVKCICKLLCACLILTCSDLISIYEDILCHMIHVVIESLHRRLVQPRDGTAYESKILVMIIVPVVVKQCRKSGIELAVKPDRHTVIKYIKIPVGVIYYIPRFRSANIFTGIGSRYACQELKYMLGVRTVLKHRLIQAVLVIVYMPEWNIRYYIILFLQPIFPDCRKQSFPVSVYKHQPVIICQSSYIYIAGRPYSPQCKHRL